MSGAAALLWLAWAGLDDDAIRATIRQTGRLAFATYLLVLVARPLQQLLRAGWTKSLLKNRRLIGVAFAGIMSTHLCLIALRLGVSPGINFPPTTLVFGAGAYALTYLMFITSFDRPKRALGLKGWKRLHLLGLAWIGIVFAAPRSVAELTDPAYLAFGIPVLLAILLRVAARMQSGAAR